MEVSKERLYRTFAIVDCEVCTFNSLVFFYLNCFAISRTVFELRKILLLFATGILTFSDLWIYCSVHGGVFKLRGVESN